MPDDRVSTHEHRYVFLRQETVPTQWWEERVTQRAADDVFVCEGCLDYRRKRLRLEEPSRVSFDWVKVAP